MIIKSGGIMITRSGVPRISILPVSTLISMGRMPGKGAEPIGTITGGMTTTIGTTTMTTGGIMTTTTKGPRMGKVAEKKGVKTEKGTAKLMVAKEEGKLMVGKGVERMMVEKVGAIFITIIGFGEFFDQFINPDPQRKTVITAHQNQ
jgi:hypothetical protein